MTATKATQRRRKVKKIRLSKVVSYRVSLARHDSIKKLTRENSIVGVKSASDFARKVLSDFLAGRLVYKNPSHIKADFDKNPAMLDVLAEADAEAAAA